MRVIWEFDINSVCDVGAPFRPGGGGGGLLLIFLGWGVPPGPENPYPISDQNIRFSIPYFRPVSQNVYPVSDLVMW